MSMHNRMETIKLLKFLPLKKNKHFNFLLPATNNSQYLYRI
jgi:hypothetical protein